MSSAANLWGTLIRPDKSPAPMLEQLCLGIAQLMPSFDSNGTTDLTPQRLATFYRKVGGNYDPLFLETKSQALSFIYQSVGCFHSLQPSSNPYESPSIPSLLPNGFVRWQTIQLLMDPDEHSQYLQNAVRLWDIVDTKGEILPKEIPRDAFPSEPDPEMLEWHEGVCRRLEYDFVKRNVHHRSSPPNFGAYHSRFSGRYPLMDEDDYVVHLPRRSRSRHHSHFESDRPSRRRHHQRRLSADYPSFGSRRPESAFYPRPDGGRSGVTSPRASSPTPWVDRPPRSRGRDRMTWYGHASSPEVEDMPTTGDVSDHSLHDTEPEARPRHRSRHHNLSPPSHSRARRHSHDAYTRKPARDLSPAAPRRSHRGQDGRLPKTSRSHPETAPRLHRSDERSRSRPPGVKFSDSIFDGPVPAPAPEPPQYTQAPPPSRVPRYRYHLDPYTEQAIRRGSYSGGSTGCSRPTSGGSSSERPRSYSSAGLHPHTSRFSSPVRSSAAKRYIPTSVAQDAGYIPLRRAPIYD
ncbi:uncharacterized protein N7459_006252 [Penicillium hispanicum]|uniref:uncharacterized protein n=1 Tax=Penicillium hispanicum TaxID=1080232 RepID=UPI0025410A4C|nr:uncharacterized protein N7459_006252 [Penicillium hispanicum]KAJ5580267.1 hypothetical protein N7459_006252 [Penicillium hispanicum]